jgi:hypothetical protein
MVSIRGRSIGQTIGQYRTCPPDNRLSDQEAPDRQTSPYKGLSVRFPTLKHFKKVEETKTNQHVGYAVGIKVGPAIGEIGVRYPVDGAASHNFSTRSIIPALVARSKSSGWKSFDLVPKIRNV